jgi:hypothetical protein
MQVDFNILNQRGTPMFFQDALVNRPTAGVPGRLFVQTDSPYGIYRDTGSAWVNVTPGGGGGSQDLEQTLANGSFLNNNYNIQMVAASQLTFTDVFNVANIFIDSTSSPSSISYFGNIDLQNVAPTIGCYWENTQTTMHGRFRTTGGLLRTFLDFDRSTSNLDLGFKDITSNVFLRINHTGSNRNISARYNNNNQGFQLDFDSGNAYFGNIIGGLDNAIQIRGTLTDDSVAGYMETAIGGVNYGWYIQRDASTNVRRISIGDTLGNFDTARIEIDNNGSEVAIITNVSAGTFRLESNGNPPIFNTPTSDDAYTPTINYWRVEINGFQYGIPLYEFNP